MREHEEEAAEKQAEKTDTGEVVSDATAQALTQAPIALLGTLMTMPGLLGRNWPLAILLVLIGALFWPTPEATAEDDVMGARKPNGSDDMPSAQMH